MSARIFISYSHRGKGPEWKAKLLKALAVFERHHLLDPWHDDHIAGGDDWHARITAAMDASPLAVLLLTPEMLGSDYVLRHELPHLRRRHQAGELRVLPVLCEPCAFDPGQPEYAWLDSLQMRPRVPTGRAALSEVDAGHAMRALATEMAEEFSRLALAERSALPAAPSELKTYLDRFPLTRGPGLREEKLIGREQELALLDLALASSFGVPPSGGPGRRVNAGLRTAIVSLVALGGVGKTMLVQHWLQRLQREGWFGARRVYAWSFYSQGTKEDRQASEDTFLAHALEWFGVQCEPTLSPWDKGRLLADAVARERTLLILDGIEPLQYPPGPMGGQLRAPGVQSLLKQLARKANSEVRNQKPEVSNCLCLVTTREPLTDLADFQRREGSPWGSVLRVDLGNLADEAGAALLHHAGAKRDGVAEIKPDDKELLAASREVDGHALTLNLLGRFLARAHGGDIRRRDLVKFERTKKPYQHAFKMLAAFENWFSKSRIFGPPLLAVLRMLGLFDRPAERGCVAALRKSPPIAGLTDPLFTTGNTGNKRGAVIHPLLEEDWNTTTSFLNDFGLLSFQPSWGNSRSSIDCHPLIREYFAMQLCEKNRKGWLTGHDRLFTYLTECSVQCPESLPELQPLFQAVGHGCLAGRIESAFRVFEERIQRKEFYVTKKLGAPGSVLPLLHCLVQKPSTATGTGLERKDAAYIMFEMGFHLLTQGRLDEAHLSIQTALSLYEKLPDSVRVIACYGDLCRLELFQGMTKRAIRSGRLGLKVEIPENKDSRFRRMELCAYLASAYHQKGDSAKSNRWFGEAEKIQKQRQHDGDQPEQLWSLQGFLYCDLLLGSGACDEVIERAAKMVGIAKKKNRPVDLAMSKLLFAQAKLQKAILENFHPKRIANAKSGSLQLFQIRRCPAACVSQLRKTLDVAGSTIGILKTSEYNHLPHVLLQRAWLFSLGDNDDDARADLDEACDIAERGPMRLHLADIHLHRARLFYRENPYPWKSPQDDLAAAEKLISDCSYHRRDEELADAKRAIFGS